MAARSVRPRLLDILESIDTVVEAVAECDLDTFVSDRILRLAVERAIEIISEAVRHVPEPDRARYPEVPWRNIMAIGNKLRHEYQRVDPDIIWEIATLHLVDLRPVIEAILNTQPK
jgi:uncharacterized protein with HEPN domain